MLITWYTCGHDDKLSLHPFDFWWLPNIIMLLQYMISCWLWLLLFCCSGGIPRLSLIQHSLYVGVVEKTPPPPLTWEQYGKMEPKYPEGGHCQSVLRRQGVFTSPFILNNSVETAAPFNVVSHPRYCEPRN